MPQEQTALSDPITVTLQMSLTIAPELLRQIVPDLDSPANTGFYGVVADLAKAHNTKITVHYTYIHDSPNLIPAP